MPSSVLLACDQPAVRRYVDACLRHAGYISACCARDTVEQALRHIAPDLLLLDATDAAGRAWLYQWRQTDHRPQLLAFGAPEAGHPADGIDLLATPLRAAALLAAVERLLAAPTAVEDSRIVIDGLSLDSRRHELRFQGRTLETSPQEFALLAVLMRHPEQVFTRDQLLDLVWGSAAYPGERTVDVAIRRLRMVLETHGLARRIETVRGVGYRFCNNPLPTTPKHHPLHVHHHTQALLALNGTGMAHTVEN